MVFESLFGSNNKANKEIDTSVLKDSRKKCLQARDEFYKCCKDEKIVYNSKDTELGKCKAARQAFEEICPPAWVQFYDKGRNPSAQRRDQVYEQMNQTQYRGQQSGKEL